MRKVGIVGGTFDPIHNGHLLMGQAAFFQLKLDEVWFMPTGTPAYKNKDRRVTSKEQRAHMTRLAIEQIPWAKYSGIEVEREGNTYTADTLIELKKQYPDTAFYYVVGADSLDYMDRWYHPEIVFQNAIISVMMRNTQSRVQVEDKVQQLEKKWDAKIVLLEAEEYDISSTILRAMAAQGTDISEYIPDEVVQYIMEEGLYRTEEKYE